MTCFELSVFIILVLLLLLLLLLSLLSLLYSFNISYP